MSLAAGVYLGALALLALAGARAGVGPGYRALVSLALAAAPLLAVDRPWLVLTGVAIAASCAARGRRVAGEDHEARLFAVALVAHMLLWTDGRIAAYALPLALLAAASVVRAAAERLAPDRAVFRWWDDRRTVVGARAVGLSTAAVTLALLPWLTAIAPLERLGIALAVGVICCLCEGASRQGSGVLSLLVGAAIGVELLVTRAEAGALAPALAWIAFAVGLALITRRLRLLTAGGAAGAAIVGVFLFTAEGPAGAIPLLAFFLLSSALSKLADRRRGAPQARGKGSTRDLAQVFANGGVAMALGLADVLLELPFAYPALVASLAAAAADTWATE
ncbi:MAG: DUF92 domain-containing protein, partial [Myxococcales bacterium]|nr:DUF92 domain-containing protein [Myxococcales bacterium]